LVPDSIVAARPPTPPLLPAPAKLHLEPESEPFTLDAAIPIQLGSDAGQETLFAAWQLQAAVHDATGLLLAVRKMAEPAGGARSVALLLAGRDASGSPEEGTRAGPEGYVLRVSPRGITIWAGAE